MGIIWLHSQLFFAKPSNKLIFWGQKTEVNNSQKLKQTSIGLCFAHFENKKIEKKLTEKSRPRGKKWLKKPPLEKKKFCFSRKQKWKEERREGRREKRKEKRGEENGFSLVFVLYFALSSRGKVHQLSRTKDY